MEHLSLSELNKNFGLNNTLTFVKKDELLFIEGKNKFAKFAVSLHGAHITSFQPHGAEDILWMSQASLFQNNRPIRGGIPVCWPWFGAHPTDTDKPSHGFARLAKWDLTSTELLEDNETVRIILELNSDKRTRNLWPYEFKLQNIITFGRQLEVELITENIDDKSLTITSALHSYFNISEIRNISVTGLEGRRYIDTIDGNKEIIQKDDITFNGEVDRVYINTQDECVISDTGFDRKITVSKAGSKSTVVWNPWIDKSQRMPDFGDDEYKTMVCVETTNAFGNFITLEAGEKHSLKAVIGNR